jgi:hypothetical protein
MRIAVKFTWAKPLAPLLETKAIEMFSIKPETLHEYIRRHFEKISRVHARQFVEQGELPELEVVPKTRPIGSTGRQEPV